MPLLPLGAGKGVEGEGAAPYDPTHPTTLTLMQVRPKGKGGRRRAPGSERVVLLEPPGALFALAVLFGGLGGPGDRVLLVPGLP